MLSASPRRSLSVWLTRRPARADWRWIARKVEIARPAGLERAQAGNVRVRIEGLGQSVA
jgi:hypothetical protein